MRTLFKVLFAVLFLPAIFAGFLFGLVAFFFHNGLSLAEMLADTIRGYK